MTQPASFLQNLCLRAWAWRSWLAWLPILLLLVPLAYGQGWFGEAVMGLLPFLDPPSGLAYFLRPSIEHTRILSSLPFAFALLTPWPEWFIATLIVLTWLTASAVTFAIARRMFPGDPGIAAIAFFLAGTSAYDISLLQSAYVPLFLGVLLHWAGLLAMLAYCESRSLRTLAVSAALQALSLMTYATAIGAIALGPLFALAYMVMRGNRSEALRSAAAVAIAWWPLAAGYLASLAWVSLQPGNYITSVGGLALDNPLSFFERTARLVVENFDVLAWMHPSTYFGNPPRVVPESATVALTLVAALLMGLLTWGAELASPGTKPPARSGLVLLSLLGIIIVSNAAAALTQGSGYIMRTHLVSRLYASVMIAACCGALLRSRSRFAVASGAVATVVFLFAGAWTVADRASYVASLWPRHRAELRSLDVMVRSIDPDVGIVLYVPRGSGYIATVAPWHAGPWTRLIRGPRSPLRSFALWSPDRRGTCDVTGEELLCQGDAQPAQRIPLSRLVLLRFDPADCRFKIVDSDWVEALKGAFPDNYKPRVWIHDPPAARSAMMERLLYGPQGLGGDVGCH